MRPIIYYSIFMKRVILKFYLKCYLQADIVSNTSEKHCNNEEIFVDVEMGEMVISAPLEEEVEEGTRNGERTRVASHLRKGLCVNANAESGLFSTCFSVGSCDAV